MICVIIKYKSETSSVWVSVLYAHPFRCTYPHLLTFIWKWDRKFHPASMQNLQQAGPAACPAILPCSSLWCGMEAPASISSNNRCTLLGVAQTWRYSKVLIATDRQTSALLWAAGPAQLTAVQFQLSHLKKKPLLHGFCASMVRPSSSSCPHQSQALHSFLRQHTCVLRAPSSSASTKLHKARLMLKSL